MDLSQRSQGQVKENRFTPAADGKSKLKSEDDAEKTKAIKLEEKSYECRPGGSWYPGVTLFMGEDVRFLGQPVQQLLYGRTAQNKNAR